MINLNDMRIDRDVMVPMRDGVRLATDIYRPDDDQPHPILIQRTAYGKGEIYLISLVLFTPEEAVRRGYGVAVQDARGTNGSEGEFNPYQQERADGHDMIRWLLDQSWCDGRLGTYGASYLGGAAMQLTVDAPPELRATIDYIAPLSFHAEAYIDGMFEAGKNVRWAVTQAIAQVARQDPGDRDPAAARAEIQRYLRDPEAFLSSSFDLNEVVENTAQWMPFIGDYLSRRECDEKWQAIDVLASTAQIRTPVLSIAGWQDPFLRSTLRLFEQLTKEGPADLRDKHRLVIGPWTHESYLGSSTRTSAGAKSFAFAPSGRAGLKEYALGWFDKWVQGRDTTSLAEPVRYFDMGESIWKEGVAWPPSATEEQRWYLGSGGRANTAAGDGVLASQPMKMAPCDTYVYDPSRPAPTVGGRQLLYYRPAGIQDQGRVQARNDVVVYTSSLLPYAIKVLGQVRLALFVRSSAPTTDFVAVLSDVDDEGVPLSVVEGTFRLPEGDHQREPFACTIDLWDTAYTFEAGHRLRLHVTSSSFPRFERNRNVGKDAPRSSWAVALQEILHDDLHPSALLLPVVPAT